MQPAGPFFEDASVSDEPSKLVDETAVQGEIQAVSPSTGSESADSVSAERESAGQDGSPGLSEESGSLENQEQEETVTGATESLPAEQGEAAELAEAASAETASAETVQQEVESGEVDESGLASEDVQPVVADAMSDEGAAGEEEIKMDWYILKVQSNREKSITAALRRKIAVEGLDQYFGDVVVPMEKVTEFKAGKKKIVERKLYPGYIVVHMHINDDTWFAVRETSGIGDFTGSGGKPTPMLPHEVARIIQTEEEVEEESPKLNISFKLGDRVKVKEGTFESFEGEVNSIDEQSGRVTVMINIFGRSTPVELEYWQAEQV